MFEKPNKGLIALVVVGVVVVIAALLIGTYGTSRHELFTVQRLDDQATKDSHKYLVFTDNGVYEDVDSLGYFKFNSSDVFGQLQVGHKYDCHVNWFRFGLTSSYPNIISCEEIK